MGLAIKLVRMTNGRKLHPDLAGKVKLKRAKHFARAAPRPTDGENHEWTTTGEKKAHAARARADAMAPMPKAESGCRTVPQS